MVVFDHKTSKSFGPFLSARSGGGPPVLILIDRPCYDPDAGQLFGDTAIDTACNMIGTALSKREGRVVVFAVSNLPGDDSADGIGRLIRSVKPISVIAAGPTATSVCAAMLVDPAVRDRPRAIYKFFRRASVGCENSFKLAASVDWFNLVNPNPPVKGAEGGNVLNLMDDVVDTIVAGISGNNPFDITPFMIGSGFVTLDEAGRIAKPKYKTIDTIAKFKALYEHLVAAEEVSLDTETESLARVQNRVLTIQFTLPGVGMFVMPIGHGESPWTQAELRYIKRKMAAWLEGETESNALVIMHNAAFDVNQCANAFTNRWFGLQIYDTMLAEHALSENRKALPKYLTAEPSSRYSSPFSLETLELMHGYARRGLAIGKDDRGNLSAQTLKDLAQYGVMDTLSTWALYKVQNLRQKAQGFRPGQFRKLVVNHLGRTCRTMAILERTGLPVDGDFLRASVLPSSDLSKKIRELQAELDSSDAVQEANRRLAEKSGFSADGLFGTLETPRIFDVGKPDHKRRLFVDVLGLRVVTRTKKGTPQINKVFFDEHKTNPVVASLSRLTSLMSMRGTFVEGFLASLVSDPDSKVDGRIRSSYSQTRVAPGRLSSSGPNLQNIPTHSKDAALIRRAFIAELGDVAFKADYSAHEIRILGNVSADSSIAQAFAKALISRLRLRLARDGKDFEAAMADFAINGDIHIQNVLIVFGVKIDASHPLRQAIKNAIFGIVYGLGPKALGKKILGGRKKTLKEKLSKIYAKLKTKKRDKAAALNLQREAAQVEKDLILCDDDDEAVREGRSVMDKVFAAWPEARDWLEKTKETGKKKLFVESPNGRRRHLSGYLHASRLAVSGMDRKGPNSVIQGAASELAVMSSFLLMEFVWNTFVRHDLPMKLKLTNMVHDSIGGSSPFHLMPVSTYLVEHAMTTMVSDLYEKEFGFVLSSKPYFDLEFGVRDDIMTKWKTQRFSELLDIGNKLGEGPGITARHRKAFKHNWRLIRDLREGELRTGDPFVMDDRSSDPEFWRQAVDWC